MRKENINEEKPEPLTKATPHAGFGRFRGAVRRPNFPVPGTGKYHANPHVS